MLGARIKRIEDPALLRGRGRFVDDIRLPGMAHAAFVRSIHAHAAITAIELAAARAVPGVIAIYTLNDLRPHLTSVTLPLAQPSAAIRQALDSFVLVANEARYVGEPIAVVIAQSRYIAEDAAALVEIAYEPLPAAIDLSTAAAPGAAPAHRGAKDNVVAAFTVGYGEIDAAFAGAPHVFAEKFRLHKGCGHAIECRGVVASVERHTGVHTVWSATQMPHRAGQILMALYGIEADKLRVIAPDVGGGFGPKFVFYPEEAVIPLAARLLGRPVKWIEDRREHFTATTQERDQLWDVEIAVDNAGRLLGLRGRMLHDHGAYTPYGVNLPHNSATNLIGPYVLPAYRLDVRVIATNKVPVTPVRGAGRPQGTFVMERMMDRIARELALDPAELRRRNLIPPERMPYVVPIKTRDGGTMTYDSGDYPASQAKALALAGYDTFRGRQSEARAAGRAIGIGMANYVEGTGRGPFEQATVRIGTSGKVSVYTGASAQGQGTKTMLAQICAAELGIAATDVTVIAGDTATIPLGLGAFASRQAVTAGSSAHLAARAVRNKTLKIAAYLLEAAAEDLELMNGRVRVKGAIELSVGFGDIARAVAGMPGYSLPADITPGLEATESFLVTAITYCNGTHVATVEVDCETGHVHILDYVVVHDSGRLINPLIVEGQVTGGAAHGIGTALFEWMAYDEAGQPLTTNFAEYLLPTAPEMPHFRIAHTVSPSPTNPLGVKGAGEGGTIPAPAAIVAAIEDALTPFGVRLTETPVTPVRIVELLAAARAQGDHSGPLK